MNITEFVELWIEGQCRKFRAEIEEWEQQEKELENNDDTD